jgi:hypothetical protein
MALVKVKDRAQITLPPDIRKALTSASATTSRPRSLRAGCS